MSTKIIVSYDGTHNEDDAIALGRLLGDAGAEVSVAFVRHSHANTPADESVQQKQAEDAVARGVKLLGKAGAQGHVVVDPSTPHGLASLAEREGAELIVFCSDSHTAPGAVTVGNSAERLITGGSVAIAIAPSGYAARANQRPARIAATGADGDSSAADTAAGLASSFGATVVPLTSEDADFVVIGSRPEAAHGQVSLNSASEYLIEVSRSPVLVVARGVALNLGQSSKSSTEVQR